MSRVKEFFRSLTPRQILLSLLSALCLLLFLGITLWSSSRIRGLSHQQAADRWDEEGGAAQVSCFFARGTQVDDFQIRSFENQLEQKLSDASVEAAGEGARLYVDAYSAQGKVTVVSEQSTLEAAAVGIGGDFFFFHPLTLVSGRYFSGDELMKDFILLDREAAWQLFGSDDIAGMSVTIGGVPHYVAGVVERETGRMAKGAGLDRTVVYVSAETLLSYGESEGISAYEVAGPDPVKHFLFNTVKENFGIPQEDMLVVENSFRYSLEATLSVLLDFGLRSMQNSAVSLPYWENMARGYEDVRALLLLLQFVLLLIPSVILLVFLIRCYRKRKWHMRDVPGLLAQGRDRVLDRFREEKSKWKHF